MRDVIERQRAFAARAAELRRTRLADKLRARELEEHVLREIITLNADTEFGRAHDFAKLRSIDDFRRAVPMRGYDELAPWIERMTRGEPRVLTAELPVLFRRTSGTSGAAKHIPVTARSLVIDHQKIALALALPSLRFPEVLEDPDAAMHGTFKLAPPSPVATPSGVPWMSYADHNQLPSEILDGAPGLQASYYETDRPLPYADAIYARLRRAVEADLRGIFAINPSSLVAIATRLAETWDQIIDEVRAGTILGEPRRPPNSRRADQLRALAGHPRPRDVWPDLRYVQCWKSASCALYLPEVRELYGDLAIIPFPYLASEGVAGVQLDDHETAGYLLPDGVLFEFLPAFGNLDATAPTQRLHELEPGQTYELVHTAWNGLYRYRIGDRFTVDSLDPDGVPRLEFVGRAGMYSSFTGEKLTEQHVTLAVEHATQALGVAARQFTCFPRWGSPPSYLFAIEPALPSAPIDADALAHELDRQLGAINDEYPSKRSSGRLGPAALELLPPGSFARLRERLIAGGANPTQLKEPVLHRTDALLEPLRACR